MGLRKFFQARAPEAMMPLRECGQARGDAYHRIIFCESAGNSPESGWPRDERELGDLLSTEIGTESITRWLVADVKPAQFNLAKRLEVDRDEIPS